MNSTLIHQIVTLFCEGASIRRIAQRLQISRRTVRRALAQVEQARTTGPPMELPRPAAPRGSQLDAHEAAIAALCRAHPEITAQRIYEELCRIGYTGGYTILSERVRRMRPRPVVAPVRRFETAPGVQAQMDYATYDLDFTIEGRRRVYAFSYVLGYSRRQYLHFVESQDFATTIREHIRAFEHLGGVAATCLYDNMKVVVSGYDGDEPVYNPRFLAFAAHYGFRPVACRAAPAPDEGEGGTAVLLYRDEFAQWPQFPGSGAPQRDHGHMAGRGRRRANSSPDQGASGGPPRGGTAPPPANAGAAFRHLRSRLPECRCRGVRGLPAELLRGAVAAAGPDRGGAGEPGRTDNLRPLVRHRRVSSTLPPDRRGPAESLPGP